MLKTRSKKILRDIRARKGRSVLAVLSIMIGVFGVAATMSLTNLLKNQIDEDIQPDHISHTHVYTISSEDSISAEDNQSYLQALKNLDGVVDVEGQAVYPVSWRKVGDTSAEDGFMIAFSEPFGEGNLEIISRIIDGRYPQPGEVAVDQRFADQNNIQLGDKLTFQGTGDQEWEIVGFVIHDYFTFSPAVRDQAIETTKAIFANYSDAQNMVGFAGLSAFHVRYENTPQSLEELDTLIEAISQNTPYVPVLTTQDDPENNFISDIFSQMTGAMDALGIVAMIVSGFLVTNIMNTIVIEERSQIGTMKSLGATLTDNLYIYAGIAFVYGIMGTALGLLLAIPLASLAAQGFASWTYVDGFSIAPIALVVGAIMGIVIPILASLIPVWNGSRISILKAMTNLGISSTWGKSRLSRAIGRLPVPISVGQALSNLWQKKGRLTLTGLTLTTAIGAFMGALALVKSLDNFADKATGINGYEIAISPQQAQDFDTISALITDNIDGIKGVYPGFDVSVGIQGFVSEELQTEGTNHIMMSGIDTASSTINFDYREGDGWQNDPTRRGVVISRPVADVMDKHAGDSITFNIGRQAYDYEIIGVDEYTFNAVYTDWQELATLAGYVDEDEQPIAGVIYVDMSGDISIEAVDDKIDTVSALLTANGVSATYHNQPEAAAQGAKNASMVGVIFTIISIVLGIVGAVGLMGALSIAVFERQREIGIMRSVGAASRNIMGQFILEGVLIGIIAWLIAIPLSILIGNGILGILPFDYLDLIYPPLLLLMGLTSVVGIAALASLLPSILASRKTVADILRYQ